MTPSKYKILHVDDDPAVTLIIGQRLSQLGFDVTAVNEPGAITDLLLRDTYHVVLLDVDMPGCNGLDLLEQIKGINGGISVIMLTGIVSMTTVLKAMRRGAAACFFKPLISIEPLAEAIQAEFIRLDRWWNALRDLSERKQQDLALSNAPV